MSTGKQLKDFDSAIAASDTDVFFAAQGGVEKKMTAAQILAYILATIGSTGNAIRTGTGAPANTLGKDGDLYIDGASSLLYSRTSGTYAAVLSMKGATGNGVWSVSGVPNNTKLPNSQDGDFAYDPATTIWYGPRAAGTWPSTGTTFGATSSFSMLTNQTGPVKKIGITDGASGVGIAMLGSPGILIPAGTFKGTSVLTFKPLISYSNDANVTKALVFQIGGQTIWSTSTGGASQIVQNDTVIRAQNGSAKSQIAFNVAQAGSYTTGTGSNTQLTIDFTQDQYLTCTGTMTNGTSNVTTSTFISIDHWFMKIETA